MTTYRDMRSPQRLDVVHCMCGEFVHMGNVIRVSTKPFNDEEGMIEKLRADDETKPILYLRMKDETFKKVDLKDELNIARIGISTYDPTAKVLGVLLDTWIDWRYNVDQENS